MRNIWSNPVTFENALDFNIDLPQIYEHSEFDILFFWIN